MKNNYFLVLKNSFFKTSALFFAFSVFGVVQNGYSQEASNKAANPEKWSKGGLYEGYSPSQEILSKRSRTTKHFKNPDGTFTAQIGGPIHYQDASGNWQDIDFAISETRNVSKGYKFSNETNDVKSFFPESSAGKSVMMDLNNGINFSWWKNPTLKLTSNGNVVKSFGIASKKATVSKNSIIYNNVYPNISEEFQILQGGMENNIIINSLDASISHLPANGILEFSQIIELKKGWQINANSKIQSADFKAKNFTISIPGLQEPLSFSSIIVFDGALTKEKALYLVNVPKDKLTSEEALLLSEHVFQCDYVAEFTQQGLKITTKLPASWLKDAKRSFPVTIDPTVTIGATTPGNFYGPITHWYGFQRHADLYLQSEIGTYGAITAIEYYKTGTQPARTKPAKVYMRSTTATTLTGTDAWNSNTYIGGLTPLFDGTTTQDATAGWKMITLTTAYPYSSGNLLLMVYDEYGGSGSAQYFAQPVVTARQAFNRVDTTNPGDGAATAVENVLPSLRITYTVEAPVITSFTPDTACSGTGTVTITGTGFAGVTSVTIGGTPVASYVVNSATQITATVGSGTTGVITVTNSNGTSSSATNFTVNASPTIDPNAGGATSVCINSVTPAFTNATAGGTWSIVAGTGTATIDTAGVVTGVTAGTVTVVYTVSNSLCSVTSTSPLTVNVLPPAITVTPSSTICSGDIQQLDVAGSMVPVVGTIGTGTTLTGATEQPTAFCNRWPSYWSQTIYTAAELTAAGFSAGNITSMAYNISTLGDGANNANFTVKIGTISSATFSSTTFVSTAAFTTVYGPSTYTHNASGWQEITFVTPYVWDGVSNIVINVTHSGADITNNSQTYYTTTPGNTTLWVRSFTGSTTTGTYSTNRLNIRFNGTKVFPVTWTPATGLFTDASATVAYTGTATPTIYAKPTVTTQYTATATNSSGCTAIVSSEVAVTTTSLPTGSTEQTFTTGQTLADLVVSGTGLIWYSDAAGTTVIPSTTVMVSGITYYVTQTANGCESNTLGILVQDSLSSPSFDISNFEYHPNPVKDILNLSHTQEISEVGIFNLLGQQVFSKKINATESQIDMSNLPQGTYLLKASIDNQTVTIKLMKQ